jgi:hypothetical protein
MKTMIKYSLAAISVIALFTGCGCKEPEIKIFKEKKLAIVEPDAVNYTYVVTPNFPDEVENMDTEEALDVITVYAIKLQSVIQEYEARVDSLKKFIEDAKLKQKEILETNNK